MSMDPAGRGTDRCTLWHCKFISNLSQSFCKATYCCHWSDYALVKRKCPKLWGITRYWLWTDANSWRSKIPLWSTNKNWGLEWSDDRWNLTWSVTHSFCFMYSGDLLLCSYTFIIVVSSWFIDCFIITRCLFVSRGISCFKVPFFLVFLMVAICIIYLLLYFTFNLFVFLSLEHISSRQHIVWLCFLSSLTVSPFWVCLVYSR